MSSDRVSIDQMASAIMEGLQDYADLATDDLKAAVKKAGTTVRKQIQTTAPSDTGMPLSITITSFIFHRTLIQSCLLLH